MPAEKQGLAYRLGLLGAMVTRVALLLTINWVMQLTEPLFEVLGSLSFRDASSSCSEADCSSSRRAHRKSTRRSKESQRRDIQGWFNGLPGVVAQIMVLDIIFSLDSVITAVGHG